jgi:hypothetical protein
MKAMCHRPWWNATAVTIPGLPSTMTDFAINPGLDHRDTLGKIGGSSPKRAGAGGSSIRTQPAIAPLELGNPCDNGRIDLFIVKDCIN